MLQELIWYKLSPDMLMTFSNNNAVQKTIADDFSRVLGWTGLLAYQVKDEYSFPQSVSTQKDTLQTIQKRHQFEKHN
jgi:hypothetical protein